MQTYTRIGDSGKMNGGGDGFVLHVPSWARAITLSSSEGFRKELEIIYFSRKMNCKYRFGSKYSH